MNKGGSYEIVDGKRVLKHRTKPATPETEKSEPTKGGRKKAQSKTRKEG